MNNKLKEAIETLKQNCNQYKDSCFGCDFHLMNGGCYLFEKAPEEYDVEFLEEEA